jgi:hypothetical protein
LTQSDDGSTDESKELSGQPRDEPTFNETSSKAESPDDNGTDFLPQKLEIIEEDRLERESSITQGDFELISEEFIEEEYLTDGGEAFLVIDDTDIVDEDIIDPKTAELGSQVLEVEAQMRTQMLVSSPALESTEGKIAQEG